jgi:hypothetical protein
MDNKNILQAAIAVMLNETEYPSTLGLSGIKRFATKHGFSIKTKKSGGRVPYVTLTKDGKSYGPFDPTITTMAAITKTVGLKEDDEPKSNKLSQFSLGMKASRVVISGEDVAKNHEKIMKLGQDIDPNFDAKYYDKTGKIVGSMSTVKIQPLNLKLRDRSLKAVAEDKPQAKK